MADSIGKAVGSQIGEIGSQVVKDLASIPKGMLGFDKGTQEAKGQGSNGGKSQGQKTSQSQKQPSEQIDPLVVLQQQDAMIKQQGLSQARRLLDQFSKPTRQEEPKTIYEQNQLEEIEKQKQLVIEEKKKAKQFFKMPKGKRARGDLHGIQAKQFGGEKGKNIVSQ